VFVFARIDLLRFFSKEGSARGPQPTHGNFRLSLDLRRKKSYKVGLFVLLKEPPMSSVPGLDTAFSCRQHCESNREAQTCGDGRGAPPHDTRLAASAEPTHTFSPPARPLMKRSTEADSHHPRPAASHVPSISSPWEEAMQDWQTRLTAAAYEARLTQAVDNRRCASRSNAGSTSSTTVNFGKPGFVRQMSASACRVFEVEPGAQPPQSVGRARREARSFPELLCRDYGGPDRTPSAMVCTGPNRPSGP